ncbi:DNA gyrase inhibitor YacG [Pelomonas sp. V22]|uniref:DNA gyrase inhibitor YacG n=1 Tax=Pelomonas sp. V22 TaxID=2822139 RepID=UPI0024A8EF3C|nr:DNA gyrase inhibitor YacG [Pelomonas sp. V22]MDI4632676.1 DNA gyrase inhibitor YacG [Pelomonas sp. V22]
MSEQDVKPRIVRCPTCEGDSVFAPSNVWRPFCSERCRQIDLGAWASESFRVEAAPPADGQDLEQ